MQVCTEYGTTQPILCTRLQGTTLLSLATGLSRRVTRFSTDVAGAICLTDSRIEKEVSQATQDIVQPAICLKMLPNVKGPPNCRRHINSGKTLNACLVLSTVCIRMHTACIRMQVFNKSMIPCTRFFVVAVILLGAFFQPNSTLLQLPTECGHLYM